MASGLDSNGLEVKTTAELRTTGRANIHARLQGAEQEPVDWENDLALRLLVDLTAYLAGIVAQGQQATYDASIPANATGVHLDDFGSIRGTARRAKTFSTARVTLAGTTSTPVPSGKVMKDSNGYRWTLTEVGTVGSGNYAIQCETAGPISLTGTLTPVTIVAGWTSATYVASSLVLGRDREGDPAYRLRQERSLQNPGQLNAAATRGRLLELSWVTHAVVVNNPTNATTTSTGVTLPPHSFGVIVYPSTPTDAQKSDLAEAIYRWSQNLGVWIAGSESATVTREDGQSETVRWTFASTVAVTVAVTVTPATGYTVAGLTAGIQTAVAGYFSLYAAPGGTVYDSEVESYVIGQVQGIRRLVITLDGGTSVTPTATQLPTVDGTASVS